MPVGGIGTPMSVAPSTAGLSDRPEEAWTVRSGAVLAPIDPRTWAKTDGSTIEYLGESNFEGFQYGKEPLWLWTKDGNALTAGWLKAKARQAVVRAIYFGGAFGVDNAEDTRGSSLPLGPVSSTPFATDVQWAAWARSQPLHSAPLDRYDGASIHTVIQMYSMLLYAKDARLDVPELDAGIARMDADFGRTTDFRFPSLQLFKNLGGPN